MKQLIILAIGLFSLIACTPSTGSPADTSSQMGDYKLRVIDSCEYIEYDFRLGIDGQYSLTHKGNCKFCKARNDKWIQKLTSLPSTK